MAVLFDYRLAADSPDVPWGHGDPPVFELRYGFMDSEVSVKVGGCDLGPSSTTGAEPVLDFAAVLMHVLRDLQASPTAAMDFTEHTATIDFVRDGDELTITPSYSTCSASCSYQEFLESAARFARRVAADVRALRPIHAASEEFAKIESDMLWYPLEVAPEDGSH